MHPSRSNPAPRRRGTRRRHDGLTLIEVMVSILVMSTMLVAALGAVGAAAQGRLARKESALGLSLARHLLAEVSQTRYRDLVNPVFGVEAGEGRATFDDVDDYEAYAEDNAAYADGTLLPGGVGWKRKVRVEWVSPADPTLKVNTDQGLKRITVKVASPSGKETTVVGLRSGADGYENTPGSQVTYTCHVGVSVQVGADPAGRNVQGVNLLNLVP